MLGDCFNPDDPAQRAGYLCGLRRARDEADALEVVVREGVGMGRYPLALLDRIHREQVRLRELHMLAAADLWQDVGMRTWRIQSSYVATRDQVEAHRRDVEGPYAGA